MYSSSSNQPKFDYLIKLLLIGDSGVGKTTFMQCYSNGVGNFRFEHIAATVGVDFDFKYLTVGGKNLKLVIWDTAGQERFRSLMNAYYRGAQGIIMVYDVTRRETFINLSKIWEKEIDLHSTYQDCVKMLVCNKVDKESERVISKSEGMEFARQNGCHYMECSAKTGLNVEECFQTLALKIVETPSLYAHQKSEPGEKSIVIKKQDDNTTPPNKKKRWWCIWLM